MQLLPWSETCLAVLRAGNTSEMKARLGGPETEAKLLDRHRRYLAATQPGVSEMFSIEQDGIAIGSIGYWRHDWNGQQVYETGWEILSGLVVWTRRNDTVFSSTSRM